MYTNLKLKLQRLKEKQLLNIKQSIFLEKNKG